MVDLSKFTFNKKILSKVDFVAKFYPKKKKEKKDICFFFTSIPT